MVMGFDKATGDVIGTFTSMDPYSKTLDCSQYGRSAIGRANRYLFYFSF